MAVDQHGAAELPMRLCKQTGQGVVVGRVETVDPLERSSNGQRFAIDLVGLRHDAGDGAKAADHAHRLGIGVVREPIAEQNRIELIRLAVDVEIGAREMGIEERGAEFGDEGEQLLDIGILGAPKRQRIEPGGGQEGGGINAAAMGRVEDERHFEARRPRHREGRRKLGLDRFSLVWAHGQSSGAAPAGSRPARELPVNSANES